MTYKRKLALLHKIEDIATDSLIGTLMNDVLEATRELSKLIEAEKPEPRWYAESLERNRRLDISAAGGWYGIYDRTYGPNCDPLYTARDEMAADVIVNLLNEAEERTDE